MSPKILARIEDMISKVRWKELWPRASGTERLYPDPVHRYLSIHQENLNLHDLKVSKHKPYDDFLKLIDRCIVQPKDPLKLR